jgi:hypothetical protein
VGFAFLLKVKVSFVIWNYDVMIHPFCLQSMVEKEMDIQKCAKTGID